MLNIPKNYYLDNNKSLTYSRIHKNVYLYFIKIKSYYYFLLLC